MNILGKRYFFFGVSLILIIPGLIILFTGGLPLSIDFTGGSLLEVSFTNQSPEPTEIIALYENIPSQSAAKARQVFQRRGKFSQRNARVSIQVSLQ